MALIPLLLAAGGCFLAQPAPGPRSADLLESSLAAEAAGDVERAATQAARIMPDTSTASGRMALLFQAVLALDPRNPSRSPAKGAELAARYLETAPTDVDAAVARFLYAMALDLGAAPDSGSGLPRLDGPALAIRLQELERAVTRLRAELARIQETIKP